MTPFEAFFNQKPTFGLSDMGTPSELASEIYDEEDLQRVLEEINNPVHSINKGSKTPTLTQATQLQD